MQLNPRYGADPIISVEGFSADPIALMVRQRKRFGALLAHLDDDQWASPSRCDGWTVQDVITHLISTNQFWAFSITAGLNGAPTRFLSTFDPVRSPAELVIAAGTPSPSETLASFMESNDTLVGSVVAVGDGLWTTLAEAPPGHVSIGCLVLHALWDSVIHERDIALPLGLAISHQPDELAASLIYATALNLALHAGTGSDDTGAVVLRTTDPDVHARAELTDAVRVGPDSVLEGAFVLTGDTLEALEALSCRTPMHVEVGPDDRWLFDGLSTVFDQVATS